MTDGRPPRPSCLSCLPGPGGLEARAPREASASGKGVTMEMRRLGSSGLHVSALGFGTMTFGGTEGIRSVGTTEVDGARRQLDLCLEAGVNLIDTADGYAQGRSEEILGQALKGRRDDVILATK